MTAEPRCWGGGGGVSHPSQLTTGLVIKSVTTSPTLAGERMLFILQVSILSEQKERFTSWHLREFLNCPYNFFFFQILNVIPIDVFVPQTNLKKGMVPIFLFSGDMREIMNFAGGGILGCITMLYYLHHKKANKFSLGGN